MRSWLAPAYKLAIGEFTTINTENPIAVIGRVFQEYWPIWPLRELIMGPGLQLRIAGGSPNQGSPVRRRTSVILAGDEKYAYSLTAVALPDQCFCRGFGQRRAKRYALQLVKYGKFLQNARDRGTWVVDYVDRQETILRSREYLFPVYAETGNPDPDSRPD